MAEKKKRRNLPPNLYLKHGQYYLVRSLPGRKREWIALGTDKSHAVERAKGMKDGSTKAVAGTVAALLDDFIDNLSETLAPTTQDAYRKRTKRLKRVFGNMTPGAVNGGHIAQYLEVHPKKVQANLEIKVLSLAYKRGIRMRQVVHNPCRDVDLAKVPKRTKLLTDAEWNTVYKAMPEWIQCAMDISYLTSLRISDVLRLQEPANGVLEIRHQKTG